MPNGFHPGVFLDDRDSVPRVIDAVPTSTAAFVGPCAGTCDSGEPVLVTGLHEVDAAAGDGRPLQFTDGTLVPYVWHAARRFFEEGGTRLYVVPVPPRADGARPTSAQYARAFARLDRLEEVSIVAAPGSTAGYEGAYRPHADAIAAALLAHVERLPHRFAILDSGDRQTVRQVRAMRATVNSSRAAMYYPWVHALDPITRRPVALPPSGSVAGVFARVEHERGVHRPAANEVLRGIVALAARVPDVDQQVLNTEGINVIRDLPGRGIRLWGARTCSADPEWKYVNVRRFINYLEVSLARGTRWAAFEPNGERLWTRVRASVEQFLAGEWRRGALAGAKAEEAFFVRCDRTTMTQTDIDEGRLVCLLGVAVAKPAEFVVIRVAQPTARGTFDPDAMLSVALEEAHTGLAEGGIPIGAALFRRDGTLLGRGHNRRVQENDPSAHGETDAFRRAGRQRTYRDTIMVTTLAPCWYCSGLIVQFGIRAVVVGESRTFRGGIDWLRERGIEIIDLDSTECAQMLTRYIDEHPDVWHEDIGEP